MEVPGNPFLLTRLNINRGCFQTVQQPAVFSLPDVKTALMPTRYDEITVPAGSGRMEEVPNGTQILSLEQHPGISRCRQQFLVHA